MDNRKTPRMLIVLLALSALGALLSVPNIARLFHAIFEINPRAWMFLLFLFLTADLIINAVLTWILLAASRANGRDRFALGFAVYAASRSLEQCATLLANVNRPGGVQYSAWFAFNYWTGRAIALAGAVWLLITLHQRRKHGKEKEATTAATEAQG